MKTKPASFGCLFFVMGLIVGLNHGTFMPFSMLWAGWYFVVAIALLTFDAIHSPYDVGYKSLTAEYWLGKPLSLWQKILGACIVIYLFVGCFYVGFIEPVKAVRAPKEMPREIAWLIMGSFCAMLFWYIWVKSFVIRLFSLD